ncbi:hypothetical protein HXX76_004553 [Chlamydomonas incerta]|uniref:Uncharacterized protein n=1 Tax=Chlamydomonas incerta TaxID=51695 RepID=A0A835TK52_CHLIN|nr:hypothetical protein HXX76_004553 [Chlamydomonas incerta]|eukprot:KAG2439190.1 hypothetical protein HXX76_004553 [Chlamydomonas incerta]
MAAPKSALGLLVVLLVHTTVIGARRVRLQQAVLSPSTAAQVSCPQQPVAFLQKTHKVTQRFLDSAVLAKQQVQERCGGYHRVLYVITEDLGPANSTKALAAAADLKTLRAALGEDGVIALGRQDFSTTFGIEWSKFPIPGHFTWNHCDAPELVWFDLFSRDLDPAIKNMWVAEYDVAWTGDIAGVFGTFPERPDFVCCTDFKSGGIGIGSGWMNFKLRTWLQDKEVKQCFIMLARYSLRYMRVFWEETRMGHLQFCEVSGAAICNKHSTWCRIHTFDQRSNVVGRDAKGGSLFHFSSHINEEEWKRQVAAFEAAARVTQRFLDSAMLAKQQVQERCGGYHRVLYAVHEDLGKGNETLALAVESDLRALRAALGEDGVIAFGIHDFSTTFGFEWGKSPLRGKFSWNHCDAPELVWYDLFGRDLDPAIKHVWAAEYDVAWTGDIAGVFGTFPERPDFVCSTDHKKGMSVKPGWANYKLRTWLQDKEVKQCFIMLARYSLRYMRVFWEETRMGHLQFCEVSGAAICNRHHLWCKIHTFNQTSDIVGRDSNGVSMYRYKNHINQEQWAKLAAGHAVVAQEAPPPDQQIQAEGTAEEAASDEQVEGVNGGGHSGRRSGRSAVGRETLPTSSAPGHIFHALKW